MRGRECMTNSGTGSCFRSWISMERWSASAAEWWETQSQSTWTLRKRWYLTRAGTCMAYILHGLHGKNICWYARDIWMWSRCIRQALRMRSPPLGRRWPASMHRFWNVIRMKWFWPMTVMRLELRRHFGQSRFLRRQAFRQRCSIWIHIKIRMNLSKRLERMPFRNGSIRQRTVFCLNFRSCKKTMIWKIRSQKHVSFRQWRRKSQSLNLRSSVKIILRQWWRNIRFPLTEWGKWLWTAWCRACRFGQKQR